jgi:hypothetical protein
LNQNADDLEGKLTAFWSDDINGTKEKILVKPRNSEDIANNRWEDGKPIAPDPFLKTTGDGTVTKSSAIGPFGTGSEMEGWHGDLLANQNNVKKIFELLGLDKG